MLNKWIHFCLKLDKMNHISEKEFRLVNWLSTSKTWSVHKYYNLLIHQYTCPSYLNKIFEFAPHCWTDTRNNFVKLKNPFCKTNMGQKQFLILITLYGTACLTQLKNC